MGAVRAISVGVVTPALLITGMGIVAVTSGGTYSSTAGSVPACASAPGSAGGPTPRLDATQLANARTIIQVGLRAGLPERAAVIAVATALRESGLRNLPGGDRDSAGLFQQRPSAGWGTYSQVTNPIYAATAFYNRLAQVPGWDMMPLTVAAQAVQLSAYPMAYARWESPAADLVVALAGRPDIPKGCLASRAGPLSGLLPDRRA